MHAAVLIEFFISIYFVYCIFVSFQKITEPQILFRNLNRSASSKSLSTSGVVQVVIRVWKSIISFCGGLGYKLCHSFFVNFYCHIR